MLPRVPQKVHSGASGFQEAPKMEPKSDTLGYFWKVDVCCYLQCVLHLAKNRSYLARHSRSLFFEAPRLKKASKGRFEAMLGPFWASFWDNCWLHFAVFGGVCNVMHFGSIFCGVGGGGRRQGVGFWRLKNVQAHAPAAGPPPQDWRLQHTRLPYSAAQGQYSAAIRHHNLLHRH